MQDEQIYQAQWVWPDDRHEMIAQFDNAEFSDFSEFITWFNDIRERHPLPEGCTWWFVKQNNPHFVFFAEPELAGVANA